MRKIDAKEYIGTLRQMVEEGHEVGMIITGSSMAPFLIHERDYICFKKPDRELRRGDMVFFQRANGQFVMHRIHKVRQEGYDIVGDAQTEIEKAVNREQIFAIVTRVKRKGKWLSEGDFWWEFFAHAWLHMIPLRNVLIKLVGKVVRLKLVREE